MPLAAGYLGRRFHLMYGAAPLAAMQGRTSALARDLVDVTREYSDGEQRFLERPVRRGASFEAAGIGSQQAFDQLFQLWEMEEHSTELWVQYPDGTVLQPAGGFGVREIVFVGTHTTAVLFTLDLVADGELFEDAP